jgi:hypothetical protein
MEGGEVATRTEVENEEMDVCESACVYSGQVGCMHDGREEEKERGRGPGGKKHEEGIHNEIPLLCCCFLGIGG